MMLDRAPSGESSVGSSVRALRVLFGSAPGFGGPKGASVLVGLGCDGGA